MGRKLGLFRAAYLVSASCMGSFAFAFDTGVISGVLSLASFQKDFGYTKAQMTNVNSNAVSILQAGAFFGCFFVSPIAKFFGRRTGLIISSIVFTIGTILQVINSGTLGTFYAGRVIAGLGIGAATVLIPMYSAEMLPKEIRGRLGACFQLFFAIGVMIAYWVTYAVDKDQSPGTNQWQTALGLQLLGSTLLLVGMCTVKESARWLAARGKLDQARESLKWVRGGEETEELQKEFDEILAGIEEEARVKENLTFKELLLPVNRYRLFIAVTIQLSAQLTGNTSLAYYATQIFSSVGAGSAAKLVTGFFGLVKVCGVTIFQLFVLDRIGRRVPFIVGAFAMGSFMLIIGTYICRHCMYHHDLRRGIQLQHVLGPVTLALRWRDFLQSYSRVGCHGGRCVAVAIQFHDVAGHTTCDQQYWLAHVFDVCHLQLRHHRLLLVCPQRDIATLARRDAGSLWRRSEGKANRESRP